MTAGERTVQVRLLNLPLRIHVEAQQHLDELIREFALLMMGAATGEAVSHTPAKLLALVSEMTSRYASSTTDTDAVRDAALARGSEYVDLVYPAVLVSTRQALIHLGEILDEADEFCRSGEHLLTLATPPEALRFRRWYLDEFIDQIDGAEPTPWQGRSMP